MPIEGTGIFAIIVLFFVVVTLMAGIRQVPQGMNYTVERFGRFRRSLTPGLGLVIPYFETIGRKMVMMEQVLDVPTQEVITKDNAQIRVDGVLFFQVLDAARASYEVQNLQQALLNLTMTNIRTVMGSLELDAAAVAARRDQPPPAFSVVDAGVSHPWGVKMTRIEIKDIVPAATTWSSRWAAR